MAKDPYKQYELSEYDLLKVECPNGDKLVYREFVENFESSDMVPLQSDAVILYNGVTKEKLAQIVAYVSPHYLRVFCKHVTDEEVTPASETTVH